MSILAPPELLQLISSQQKTINDLSETIRNLTTKS